MPDIRSRLVQYSDMHRYVHGDDIQFVTFVMNTNSLSLHERYYNYGFSKCIQCACNECDEDLFGPFRLVGAGIMDRARQHFETKDGSAVDYYEAARIAYRNGHS